MIFSLETALLLDEALLMMGISRDVKIMDPLFKYFPEELLYLIEELTLTNTRTIDELVMLPNLKKLAITSINRDKIYNDDIPLNSNSLINHIHDFSAIEKMTNLETLVIDNDIYLKRLDLTRLRNLRELVLTNNPNFRKIKGLDELKNLEKVVIYGNALVGDIDIDKYMRNTISTNPNILDVKLYNSIIKNTPDAARKLSDSFLLGLTYVKFAEKNGFMKLSILNNDNLDEMYTKLNRYFKKMNAYEMTDYEKIALIYTYTYQHIDFAEKQLLERQELYLSYMARHEEIPQYLEKYFASLHSSYNAYHFKLANCEGAANLMSFMCDMLGIENATVHCIDKRSRQIDGTNHAMLRVKLDGCYYYLDPTFHVNSPLDYFMVDIETVMQDHQVSAYEKEICTPKRYKKVYKVKFNKGKSNTHDENNKPYRK